MKIKKFTFVLVFINFLIIFTYPSPLSSGQDDTWFNRTLFLDDWDYQRSKIDIDSAGNIIIVGTASSGNYPLKNAFDSRVDFNFNKIFISKFSTSGEMLWSSYLGEGDITRLIDFKIDKSDNIIITGQTLANSSTYYSGKNYVNPGSGPYYGFYNIFLANITSSGAVAWFTIIGGGESDYPTAVVLDDVQNIVILGESTSPNFPLMNPISSNMNIYSTPIILKFDDTGSLLLSSFLSYLSAGEFDLVRVSMDHEDELVLLVRSYSYDYFDEFFLLKLNSSYNLKWKTEIYSEIEYQRYFYDMTIDNSSNIYITGMSGNEDKPITYEDYEDTYVYYDLDQYLMKINSSGTLEWEKWIGGTSNDEGVCISVNSNQEVLLGGNTYSADYPVSSNVNTSFQGETDFTVIKTDNTGMIVYSSLFGGDAFEKIHDLVYDENSGRILVLMATSSQGYRDQSLMILELTPNGQLMEEISFAERVPLPVLITQILFLIIALVAGIAFLIFFTGYVNRGSRSNAVITYNREKMKNQSGNLINFIERLSYCPNDNTKMFSRTDRTIQTSEFTLTRNIKVSVQNAVAIRKIPPYAVETISSIAEEIFTHYSDLFEIQMVALECSQCKFAGAVPRSLPKSERDNGPLQTQYQVPERTVQFDKRIKLPSIQKIGEILKQTITLNSQKIRPLLKEIEAIYVLYLLLGIFTLVQTTIPGTIEINMFLGIIYEYFQNFIFILIFALVLWRFDKKIQVTMTSNELMNLMGLSILFGIPFAILRMFLLEYIPTPELMFIPSIFINIDPGLLITLIINLIPVLVMVVVFSNLLGKYTTQSRIMVMGEVVVFGVITAVGLIIAFQFALIFTFLFGIFI
ncbi:MAG: hypothetical protein ACW981_00820 [Candidatus Hodarchaeales archaeon]|jgi:hypothetical protein